MDCSLMIPLHSSTAHPQTLSFILTLKGIEKAERVSGVEVCYASSVGRVLSVVATGKSFKQARKRAYKAIAKIKLDGSHYRHDIAAKVAE
jgi:phosphoribosylamine--glycine ligase